MKLTVLGSGCKTCHKLYENAKKATADTNIEVEYITDLQKVMEYGVMSMPALAIGDNIVSSGHLLKPAEIKKIINDL